MVAAMIGNSSPTSGLHGFSARSWSCVIPVGVPGKEVHHSYKTHDVRHRRSRCSFSGMQVPALHHINLLGGKMHPGPTPFWHAI
eukprot:1138867-Pelagomonas_calceolata.AAC.2